MHPVIKQAIQSGRPIIGIDEVGRGAWAGPVVAAAVIVPPQPALAGVRDSKLMTAGARARANRDIRAQATAVGLGWVAAAEVDARGLSWAIQQSGLRALAALTLADQTPEPLIILDGSHNYLAQTPHDSIAIVKADATVLCVSAASVVAKVARDNYLVRLGRRYPHYGFADHKGYGTAGHRAALVTCGPCAEHRQSYAPLKLLAQA